MLKQNPNHKSFRQTQTKLNRLLSEYDKYGFKQNDIIQAWQQCQENENKFHDILIQLINQNDFLKKEQLQSRIKIKNQNNEKRLFQSKLRMKSNEEIKYFEAQTLIDQLRSDNENYPNRIPTGLMNLGNTCYLNIMLQFIYNIIPFRQLIFKISLEQSTDGDINGRRLIQQIKELFALMQSSNRQFINPKEFIETLEEITLNTGFQLSEQNDYSEILILFFDEVEKAIANLNNEQISYEFFQIFQGKSEENLIVNKEVIKSTETSFQSISLELNENNLQQAFYSSRQLYISDYEGPDGKKQQAIIHQNIKEVPKVLQFYLNRVQYEQNSNSFVKSNQQFHFDSSIDINQLIFQNSILQSKDMKILLQQEQQILDSLKNCGDDNLDQQFNFLINFFQTTNQEKQFLELNHQLLSIQEMNKQLQQYHQVIINKRKQLKQHYQQIQIEKQKLMEFKKNIYHLNTVLMHSGDANCGHYYCYILYGNNWWKFNDRIVSQVDYPTVYKDATGQIDQNQNVSGLIYVHQEILQMENQISLPDDLQSFVNKQNEELLIKIDQQYLLNRKTIIAQKAQEYKTQQLYTNIIQTFLKYQSFTEFIKNHPNKIYYLRNKMIDLDLNYCSVQLKLPHNLQKYKEFMRKQSGLLPNDYEILFKKEESQFQLGNNILANCQIVPQININNISNALTQFTKLCQQFCGIDDSIYKYCQLFLQSILLMGCFFCDVLIQKNKLKEAQEMIYLLIDINKKSTHTTQLITQQIHQNLKYAVEQLEQLKPKTNTQFPILQPSIVMPDIQLPISKLQIADLKEFLTRIQLLEKNIEIWSNFVGQITISQNIIPQQKRLDIEMPLYFNEKIF